jgi:hypothetical protein
MDIYTIVSTVVIPFIVMGLRKIKLPVKFAPLAALVIAAVLVGVGQLFGLAMDVNTIADAIIKALATAGVAVLSYDTVRKLAEPK